MPIVDGMKSPKMIRSFENTHPEISLSDRAACNGRVPVFAVSASLVEKDRQLYIDGGFDGWIPKPIDFKRLNTLLVGIVDKDIRGNCLYKKGTWERGGWFYGEGNIGGDNWWWWSLSEHDMIESMKWYDFESVISICSAHWEHHWEYHLISSHWEYYLI